VTTISFIDDGAIEKSYRLTRFLNHPHKISENPVITKTEDWESLMCVYGSVIHDESRFHAYYTIWWLEEQPPFSCRAEGLAYATSSDGINWVKPSLDIVREVNDGRNNLIRYGLFADQPCVLRLREPHDSSRYVMAYYGDFPPLGSGVRLCFSEDGINWDWPGRLVWQTPLDVISKELDYYAADDTINFYFDSRTQKYVLLRKVMQDGDLVYDANRHGNWRPGRESLVRSIARCQSHDLIEWTNHRMILTPDLDDPPGVDFHRLGVTPYRDGYLGLLEMLDATPDKQTMAIDLVFGEDGLSWKRPCRSQQPFLHPGKACEWDGGVIFTPPQFLVHEDQILVYYGGMQARMNEQSMAQCKRYGVGLATLPLDRFCSLRSSEHEPGLLITKPVFIANSISVNATVGVEGFLQVALYNSAGEIIPGFGWDECNSVGRGGERVAINWNNCSLPGADKYMLGIRSKAADLFAIYTE
jgi:predicted GH43/DUF377 family glycosyl hydrolase